MQAESAGMAEGPGIPGLVSVVIPTYNRGYIIGDAIENVLHQTYPSLDVIVVDDGSTDNTRAVVAQFGPRVRYFHQPNRGVSGARNLGLRQAAGQYIALLDSDDKWLPWKIGAQVNALRMFPEVGMVWTDMAAVNEAGDCVEQACLRARYKAWRHVPLATVGKASARLSDLWADAPPELATRSLHVGNFFAYMILGNLVSPTVLLTRARLRDIGGFDESLRRSGEDYEFYLRACYGGATAFLDAPAMQYRVGADDQLTAEQFQIDMARNNLTTVLRWTEQGRDHITLPASMLNARLAKSYAWAGEQELRAGDVVSARRHLWKSVRINAREPRRCLLLACALLPGGVFRAAWGALKRLRALRAEVSARVWSCSKPLKSAAASLLIPWARLYIRFGSVGREIVWKSLVEPRLAWRSFPYVATTQFGVSMEGNTQDLIQQYIYYFGVWEPNLTAWIQERLKPGDVFIDVGANIGYFSLLASGLVGEGAVVAIEPAPAIHEALKRNIQRNCRTNIRTLAVAASADRGRVNLYHGPDSNSGETSMLKRTSAFECVETAPLDELLSADEIARARVMKIDVEGAEHLVIRGMANMLQKVRPDFELVVEITPHEKQAVEGIFDIMSHAGFHAYVMENSYASASYLTRYSTKRPSRLTAPLTRQTDVVFSKLDAGEL